MTVTMGRRELLAALGGGAAVWAAVSHTRSSRPLRLYRAAPRANKK
jgi:hypothetical protein